MSDGTLSVKGPLYGTDGDRELPPISGTSHPTAFRLAKVSICSLALIQCVLACSRDFG